MTTRIHVVNFGPQTVEAEIVNPETKEPLPGPKEPIYVQGSRDFYVYDTQAVIVREKTNG